MARINWLDDNSSVPSIEERAQNLEHFTQSMADGVIDADELATQRRNVEAAMRAVQDDLTDEQHEKVTALLVEMTAFNIMGTLHELSVSRLRAIAGE
jgi:hypothetical protein